MATASSKVLEPPSKKAKTAEGKATRNTTLLEKSPFPVEALVRQHETIILLPVEQLLMQLLLDYRDEILSDPASPMLEIWFTGGWVRDKLLGIQTMDIDAALSTMTGMQFGLGLENFYSRNRAKYVYEAEMLCVSSSFKLHKVDKKPEKSKNLETGAAHIFGLDVDFVNLRGETYTEDSRNPQMEFATAEEDAFRRDATVNALFYNVGEQKVEDFTGKGLQDMAAGIMRTPLDPHQTFVDDPLRVLRLIRFASRLGYAIDDGAKQSMKDERIHASLNAKISRERVGIEVMNMMSGRNPLMAYQLIYDMGLYSTVFLNSTSQSLHSLTSLLPDKEPGCPWPSTWPHAYRLLTALFEDTTVLGQNLARSEAKGENVWIMAAYAPIAALRRTEPRQAIKDATNAMKITHNTSKLLEDGLNHMDDIQSKLDLVSAHVLSVGTLPRSTVGMAIRSWGATWRLQVLFSLLGEVVYEAFDDDFFSTQLTRYSKFLDYVNHQKLQDAHLTKPILNGDDVRELFKIKKSGPFMRSTLDGIARWQFDNEESSKDDAIEWLRTQKGVFGIP